MKNVVITGSARGFGFAMLRLFYERGNNVVILDVNEDAINKAKAELEELKLPGRVLAFKLDVTDFESVQATIAKIRAELSSIDIWINNAGVNQNMVPIWDLDEKTISRLIDIDLKGAVYCSKAVLPIMLSQNSGQIYNVEGFGSNDAKQMGLSVYGTAKRAVTYFTEALAYEVKEAKKDIQIGKITPGIMITNFINHPLGDGKAFELSAKTKNVYNYLGDRPETIAEFMVEKIIKNKKNDVKFTWLTSRKAMWRFMSGRGKRVDFFKEGKDGNA